ncbi:MobF family relaxase [Streptosporangium subroseum]|uniref:MobF family relaxase n=1 Tax=Streptosporangium subroseum TaxID=106412 RepID=UPI00343D576F
MAWVTKLGPSQTQVDYRLTEGAGCRHENLGEHQGDAQMAYRLADERGLMWIGEGLRDVGITLGSALTADQYEAARALMDGRHPESGVVLVEAKKAVDPRAMLGGAPLLQALEQTAAMREMTNTTALMGGNTKMAERAAQLARGVQRKGEAYLVSYEDARKLARAAALDLSDVYEGEQLAEARRWRKARVRVGNRGYDLTMDMTKSVSMLHGLSAPAVSAVVEKVFAESVIETVAAVEGWVAYGQRGRQGGGRLAKRTDSSGLLGWVMWHQFARPVDGQAPDPHLHAHVQIANMVHGTDGKWSAVAAGGRDLHRHAHAADALVKARVRRRLTQELGVRWERDAVTGAWEIAGIGEAMRTRFSKRDGQVKAMLADHGMDYDSTHQHARRVASATSRQSKQSSAAGGDSLVANWHAQCAADGVDAAAELAACLHPGEGLPQRPGAEEIAAWIWREGAGLTSHTKMVSRADVLAAVIDACPDGVADLAEAETLTDEVLEFGPAVRLPDAGASHLVNSARYTSVDIIDAEQQTLGITIERYDEGVAVLDADVAELAIGAFEVGYDFTFSLSQRQVLQRFLCAGHGVDALIGVAGAGKTTIMAAARSAWESRGLVVAGAATAAVAAANLSAESGIGARTIAAWLMHIADPERRGLDGVDVLVIDEAAMVDDRDLAVLLGEAQRTGTKVVAIGDPLQLRAVGVGGTFAAIHRQTGGLVLDENRRQRDPIERRALELWREGNRGEALHTFSQGGRVHAGRDATDTQAALLADWSSVRTGYGEVHDELAAVLVLAGSNADTERINTAARAIRRQNGELAGPDELYRLPGGRTLALAVGDHVRLRKNDYRSRKSRGKRADVLNGYRGTVVAINADRSVVVQWRQPGADGPVLVEERVSPAYISAGGLSHGTAMTVAAAQGLSSEHALVYGMGLDPHTLYAAMTRDRLSAHLYLPRNVLESDADRARHGEPRNPTEELQRALDAYAATLQGDRADRLITAEPEPIAHRQGQPARSVDRPAHPPATARAQAARALSPSAALLSLVRSRDGIALLSDAELAQRLADLAGRTTTGAASAADADQWMRRLAEHGGGPGEHAVRARRAELAEQLARIQAVETAESTAARLQEAKQALTNGRATTTTLRHRAQRIEARLGTLKSWWPGDRDERTRLHGELVQVRIRVEQADARNERLRRQGPALQDAAEQAAAAAAGLQAPPRSAWPQIRAQHAHLNGDWEQMLRAARAVDADDADRAAAQARSRYILLRREFGAAMDESQRRDDLPPDQRQVEHDARAEHIQRHAAGITSSDRPVPAPVMRRGPAAEPYRPPVIGHNGPSQGRGYGR